jgi:hypothetical protein
MGCVKRPDGPECCSLKRLNQGILLYIDGIQQNLFYLLILGIYKDACSNSDFIVSNRRVISFFKLSSSSVYRTFFM